MSKPAFQWNWFERLPIVGILRGFDLEEVRQAAGAAIDAGLTNLEVTMNTPAAPQLIRELRSDFGRKANIGAGTVCSLSDLETAMEAGACFIVTPVLVKAVVSACAKLGTPSFPGTFTPTELEEAFRLGASVAKVFPSEVYGPGYVAQLKEICREWRLMPTGGVTVESLPAYYEAGATGFGIGSPLFDKAQIRGRRWGWVGEQVRRFAEAYEKARAAC